MLLIANVFRYWIFRAWGRVGTTIGGNKVDSFGSKALAKEEFERLYLEKTGNLWEDRDNFTKQAGKFYPLDVVYDVVSCFCGQLVLCIKILFILSNSGRWHLFWHSLCLLTGTCPPYSKHFLHNISMIFLFRRKSICEKLHYPFLNVYFYIKSNFQLQ